MMVLTLFGYLLRKNDVINDNGIQIISILVTKFILPMNKVPHIASEAILFLKLIINLLYNN